MATIRGQEGLENIVNKPLIGKQLGASVDTSTVKKKALKDVGNTLYKKSPALHSASKSGTAPNKPTMKGINLMKVFNDKENVSLPSKSQELENLKGTGLSDEHYQTKDVCMQQEDVLLSSGCRPMCDDNVIPVCDCYEKSQDEFADPYFKDLVLSKKQIEDLALVWENPPTWTPADKIKISEDILKKICVPDEPIHLLQDVTDIPALKWNSIPSPIFDPEDEMWLNDNTGFYSL